MVKSGKNQDMLRIEDGKTVKLFDLRQWLMNEKVRVPSPEMGPGGRFIGHVNFLGACHFLRHL